MTDAASKRPGAGGGPGAKKPKKGWASVVANLMGIAFKWLTDLLFLIQKFLVHCINAFMTLTLLLTKLLVNPNSHVLAWVAVFGVVMVITTIQWFRVGTWFLGIFGVVQAWGIPTGVLGVAFGTCMNLFQATPMLYKIDRNLSQAYVNNNIDVDAEDDFKSPKSRLSNWLSAAYKGTKQGRKISHIIEIVILVTHTFLTFAGLQGFLLGIIALVLPEKTLERVADVSALMALHNAKNKTYESDEEFQKDKFRF